MTILSGLLALPFAVAAEPLKALEPDSVQRIAAEHGGKPYLLVLWSLDCVYCKASLKTLAAEGKRRKLDLVTIATDPATDAQIQAQLRQRLDDAGIESDAWAFGDAPAEQLRYAIDPAWYGELPRSYWFDGRGGRRAYSGVITPEMIARLLPAR